LNIFNFNTRYFDDRFEGLPSEGYFTLFKRMVDHPNIHVMLQTDYFNIRHQLPKHVPVIYTGAVDRYFDYKLGNLSWRTLDFEQDMLPTGDYQGTSVMNYADESFPYTRIHEFRHLHPERDYVKDKTIIFREYSRFAQKTDEPYYPINTPNDKKLYDAYDAMAQAEGNMLFGGRLGTYRYLDMHQAIGAAMKVFEHQLKPYFTDKKPLKS
jgi:UDP-galactopyranose mutase